MNWKRIIFLSKNVPPAWTPSVYPWIRIKLVKFGLIELATSSTDATLKSDCPLWMKKNRTKLSIVRLGFSVGSYGHLKNPCKIFPNGSSALLWNGDWHLFLKLNKSNNSPDTTGNKTNNTQICMILTQKLHHSNWILSKISECFVAGPEFVIFCNAKSLFLSRDNDSLNVWDIFHTFFLFWICKAK